MDVAEVRRKIKEIISRVASLDPREISDDAVFADDLDLDSLSIFEIGIDIDYEFHLGVPDERLGGLRTVEEAVARVMRCLTGESLRADVA